MNYLRGGCVRGFFKTVAVVTVFSVSEKFLGFLYRIFMSRTIGTEGIGLYQVALSVFSLFYTASCSGTPVTVSRLMTKYRAEGQKSRVDKVITAGISVSVGLAAIISVAFLLFRNRLGFLFTDERVMKVFLIILPGLIFTSVYSVLRGVFWGNKDFLTYSIIELLEEICMIITGIVLISFSTDAYQGAERAAVAVLVSYVFSFSAASAVFFIKKGKLKSPFSEFTPLIRSAAPVTAMRTANSVGVALVSVILPLRLVAAGYTSSEAMSFFGAAAGQAIPLLFIPTTLIGSFTLVLIPELSENYYGGNQFYLKRDIEKALKITVTVACFFIPVFFVCGNEIGIIVFDSPECGKYLTASAYLMLFMSLSNITTSMLNSMGMENRTLVFFVISAAFMFLSVWFLPLYIGIYALLVGFSFVYGITTLLNLILINKSCKQKPRYLSFSVSAVLFTVPSVLSGYLLKKLIGAALGCFLTLFICGFVCVAFLFGLFIVFGIVDGKKLKEKCFGAVKSFINKRKSKKGVVARQKA